MAGGGPSKRVRALGVGTTAFAGGVFAAPFAVGDTLEGSLGLAYLNNAPLTAQRASVRATDEGVPQALAGYRPRVSFNGSVGTQYTDSTTRSQTFGIGNTYSQLSGTMTPSNVGVTATQTLYNGFQ